MYGPVKRRVVIELYAPEYLSNIERLSAKTDHHSDRVTFLDRALEKLGIRTSRYGAEARAAYEEAVAGARTYAGAVEDAGKRTEAAASGQARAVGGLADVTAAATARQREAAGATEEVGDAYSRAQVRVRALLQRLEAKTAALRADVDATKESTSAAVRAEAAAGAQAGAVETLKDRLGLASLSAKALGLALGGLVVATVLTYLDRLAGKLAEVRAQHDAAAEAARRQRVEVVSLGVALEGLTGRAAYSRVSEAEGRIRTLRDETAALRELGDALYDAANAPGGRLDTRRPELTDGLRARLRDSEALKDLGIELNGIEGTLVDLARVRNLVLDRVRDNQRAIFDYGRQITGAEMANRDNLAFQIARYDDLIERARERARTGEQGAESEARINALLERRRELGREMEDRFGMEEPAKPGGGKEGDGDALHSLQRQQEAERVLVEARRAASTEQAIHENALARERLAHARAVAADRIALLDTEDRRRRASFLVAEEYDRRERLLTLESIRLRERAAQEAANAGLERERIRSRAIESRAEREAVVAAAEEEAAQAGTAAARQADEERERLATEMQTRALARARELGDAQIAEMERVSGVVSGGFGAFADVFGRDLDRTEARFLTLLDGVSGELEQTKRDAEAALASGLIGEGEAERRIEAAKESAKTALKEIARAVAAAGPVTDELADSLERVADAIDGPDTSWAEDLADTFDEIARTAYSIADALDAVGERGAARVVGGLGNVARAGGTLAMGIGSGNPFQIVQGGAELVSSIGGLVTGFAEAREAARLQREAFEDSARAVRGHTDTLLSGQVGEEYTADQLAAYDPAAVEAARGQVDAAKDTLVGSQGFGEAQGATRDLLRDLAAAGLDVSDLQDMYADALAIEDLGERREALGDILDEVDRRFGGLAAGLNTYADDIPGALAQLDDDLRRAGRTGADALSRFFDKLDAAGFAELSDMLEGALSGLTPGTDEYEAALEAFYQRVQNGEVQLPGGMSMADFERVMDGLDGIGEGGSGAAGAESTSVSSVNRATVEQADLIGAYLQQILREHRTTNEILGGLTSLPPVEGDAPDGGDGVVEGASVGAGTPVKEAAMAVAPKPDLSRVVATLNGAPLQPQVDAILERIYGVLERAAVPQVLPASASAGAESGSTHVTVPVEINAGPRESERELVRRLMPRIEAELVKALVREGVSLGRTG